MKVYLLLGSNIEPRIEYINLTLQLIEESVGRIEKASQLYKTAAWGNENQEDFLNKAICVNTELVPQKLLSEIKLIEIKVGRQTRERWGKREIDIDILLIENLVVKTSQLEVPHPQLHLRNFALLPLKEIAPNIIHPTLIKTIDELAASCADIKAVEIFSPNKKTQ